MGGLWWVIAGLAGASVYKEKLVIKFVKRFWNEEEGVTAIEYGLIAALIAVVIIASVELVGTGLDKVFSDIAAKLPTTP